MGLDKQHYAHISTNKDNTNMLYAIEKELHSIENIENDDSDTKHNEIIIKGLEFQFIDMQQSLLDQKIQSSLYTEILEILKQKNINL